MKSHSIKKIFEIKLINIYKIYYLFEIRCYKITKSLILKTDIIFYMCYVQDVTCKLYFVYILYTWL